MGRTAGFVVAAAFLADAGAEGLYSDLYEPGVIDLDSVIGMEVLAPGGELVGKIREILFDRASGRIEGIALERGTYPIEALVSADDERRVVAEPSLDAASAGASTFRTQAPHAAQSSGAFVIDLREARVRPRE
jgi:sporulation protein YlmC with PRC-barrel domain